MGKTSPMPKSTEDEGLLGRRVVLICTSISHPRHHRRARMLSEAGLKVRVYGFEREWHSDNVFPEGVDVISLGVMKSGNYIKRLPSLFQAARKIRKAEAGETARPVLQYAFGLDSALIAMLAMDKRTPLLYEVGDIRNPEPTKSTMARMIYMLERTIVRRAARVVVTAPAFLANYYIPMHQSVEAKGQVVENKLPGDCIANMPRPVEFVSRRPTRLGFIGALRYENSLLPMIDAVRERQGVYEFHIYGDGPLREAVRARVGENVFYHGPFRNPEELSKIYDAIDINYVVYDNRDANVRMALPNKLYESIYFGKPLIVASETQLSKRVEELGIGFVTDPRCVGFAKKLLDTLCIDDVRECANSALALGESVAVQNDRQVVKELLQAIDEEK